MKIEKRNIHSVTKYVYNADVINAFPLNFRKWHLIRVGQNFTQKESFLELYDKRHFLPPRGRYQLFFQVEREVPVAFNMKWIAELVQAIEQSVTLVLNLLYFCRWYIGLKQRTECKTQNPYILGGRKSCHFAKKRLVYISVRMNFRPKMVITFAVDNCIFFVKYFFYITFGLRFTRLYRINLLTLYLYLC